MLQEPNYEVQNSTQLNKFLAGVLRDLRTGKINPDEARGISLVADKINKNNVNVLEYKKLTKNQDSVEFFETNTVG